MTFNTGAQQINYSNSQILLNPIHKTKMEAKMTSTIYPYLTI